MHEGSRANDESLKGLLATEGSKELASKARDLQSLLPDQYLMVSGTTMAIIYA